MKYIYFYLFYNFKFNALFTLQQHKTEGTLVSINIILNVVIL